MLWSLCWSCPHSCFLSPNSLCNAQVPTDPSPQHLTPLASPAAAGSEPQGPPLTPEYLQTTGPDSDGEELDIIEQAGTDIWQTGTGAAFGGHTHFL